MPLTFYPNEEDLEGSTLQARLEHFMTAAEQYKAAVLETKSADTLPFADKLSSPRDMLYAYNWDHLARLLRELRELPEQNPAHRLAKADHFMKLAEVYEVLRSAKMPKLEAVRLALLSEASQLKGAGV